MQSDSTDDLFERLVPKGGDTDSAQNMSRSLNAYKFQIHFPPRIRCLVIVDKPEAITLTLTLTHVLL